jgi:hypothetical protein
MTKIITTLAFFITTFLAVNAQQYEQGMGKALGFWKEGKSIDALAILERIALTEKDNWLPNYYIALICTNEAFNPSNKDKINTLLSKADEVLALELGKNPNNAELLLLQAMSKTALLASDPMTYGMTLSPKIAGIYARVSVIAPENPRVVFCKAEFEMGVAKWTGADVKKLCDDVEKSIGLFATFKDETPFYPRWGLDRAQANLKNCFK